MTEIQSLMTTNRRPHLSTTFLLKSTMVLNVTEHISTTQDTKAKDTKPMTTLSPYFLAVVTHARRTTTLNNL